MHIPILHRHEKQPNNAVSEAYNHQILGRFRFAGNIKLSNEVSASLTDDELRNIRDAFKWIVQEIKYATSHKDRNSDKIHDECLSYHIGRDCNLIIDYVNGNVNLYIHMLSRNECVQVLDYDTLCKIISSKTAITAKFEEYINTDILKSPTIDFAADVHEVYLDRVNNRGSPNPKVNLAADFDLNL